MGMMRLRFGRHGLGIGLAVALLAGCGDGSEPAAGDPGASASKTASGRRLLFATTDQLTRYLFNDTVSVSATEIGCLGPFAFVSFHVTFLSFVNLTHINSLRERFLGKVEFVVTSIIRQWPRRDPAQHGDGLDDLHRHVVATGLPRELMRLRQQPVDFLLGTGHRRTRSRMRVQTRQGMTINGSAWLR